MKHLLALTVLCALAQSAAADEAAGKPIDLAEVQAILVAQHLDGWLLYDFHGGNEIANEVAHPAGMQTRRWFYLIPAHGAPVALVHKIEAANFVNVPGDKIEYASWRELDAGLDKLLKGRKRIAMEYSPGGAIPYLGRVDGGTLERVRARGVTIVSSAELVQAAKSRWDAAGKATHIAAVADLVALKDEAFRTIAARITAGAKVTEYDIQQQIYRGYKDRGLETDYPPIVATNAHAANPHYEPTAAASSEIKRGDLVLIDLWARKASPTAIYGDMTFMGYVGDVVPERFAKVFSIVAQARDAAVAFVRERVDKGQPVAGYEADDVARGVITKAGYGDKFIHRTGHSIDTHVHGDGANLDDFETHDTRPLVDGVGFSVEPGIYLTGDFGVRSEIDCHIEGKVLEVTVPQQLEIVPLLK